jgi:hypothetical protein
MAFCNTLETTRLTLDKRHDKLWTPEMWDSNMHRILIWLVLTFIALPASAQSRDENWTRCGKADDADRVIVACTAIIQSGRETRANLAIAYQKRGFA